MKWIFDNFDLELGVKVNIKSSQRTKLVVTNLDFKFWTNSKVGAYPAVVTFFFFLANLSWAYRNRGKSAGDTVSVCNKDCAKV